MSIDLVSEGGFLFTTKQQGRLGLTSDLISKQRTAPNVGGDL
jgi:hypothetical protein